MMQHVAARCRGLFVYGTLRRGMALHAHLTHLCAAFEAEGRVRGELFDLGRYPGARQVEGEGNWVTGELFQLRQPEQDLRTLDEVEGFDPRDPESSEFVRALAERHLGRRHVAPRLDLLVGPERRRYAPRHGRRLRHMAGAA